MSRIAIFNTLLLAVSSHAIVRGGAPERIAGVALLGAAAATWLFQSSFGIRFVGVEYGVLLVDLILLAVLLCIAAYADRWWTLWIAAFHMLGTSAHLVRFLDADVLRFVYALFSAAWSYPIVLLLAVGTLRHRDRLARYGSDLDWTPRAATQ